jgi:hypothetical protein
MTDRLISLKAAVEAAEAVTNEYAQDECGQAIVAAIKALPDAWQPIETYKGGKALFYCPPTDKDRMKRPEYYTFERPIHRPPTHWMPLPEPPK